MDRRVWRMPEEYSSASGNRPTMKQRKRELMEWFFPVRLVGIGVHM